MKKILLIALILLVTVGNLALVSRVVFEPKYPSKYEYTFLSVRDGHPVVDSSLSVTTDRIIIYTVRPNFKRRFFEGEKDKIIKSRYFYETKQSFNFGGAGIYVIGYSKYFYSISKMAVEL